MKICILGSHDFCAGSRGGTIHIAETLAAEGHAVTYIPSQVSMPLWFARRSRRRIGIRVLPTGVLQITLPILMPWRVVAHGDRLGIGPTLFRMNRAVEQMTPSPLKAQQFDLCVASAAGTLTLTDWIRADRYVYRRNDILSGFTGVPHRLIEFERELLRSGRVALASCVNEYLASDLRSLAHGIRTNVVPNGISLDSIDTSPPDNSLMSNRDRNVLYVGAITNWVDVPLIIDTARRLPDFIFHIVGPWHVPMPPKPWPRNLRIHGPVAHHVATRMMKACAVGIIPSGTGNIGRMVVKPIKYYEYLAAGMGVAGTSNAGEGLEPFAVIADGVDDFARAILEAPRRVEKYRTAIRDQVTTMDWKFLVPKMLEI